MKEVSARDVMATEVFTVSPTLVLLAPLYALHPDPLTLAAVQALVVALAMVPLYRLVGRDMGEAGAAVLALALLAVPGFFAAGLGDFHAASFLPVLMLVAYWALEQRRHVVLAVVSVAALGRCTGPPMPPCHCGHPHP